MIDSAHPTYNAYRASKKSVQEYANNESDILRSTGAPGDTTVIEPSAPEWTIQAKIRNHAPKHSFEQVLAHPYGLAPVDRCLELRRKPHEENGR